MTRSIFTRDKSGRAGQKEVPLLVLRLSEIGPDQRLSAGGKAANLAALSQAGMPVPRGFCVTTAAFDRFPASCSGTARISALWSQCSSGRIDQIAALSRETRSCLAEAGMPAAVRNAVLAAWRELGEERSYAVRSSATVEDASEWSFAGQFESFLNVRGAEALLDAIKSCWLSLFSERALVYLVRQGISATTVKMAVVVQEMIEADFSGVMFTADPLTRVADRMVVEWVRGLGDVVVQGTREPKRMVVDKQSRRGLEPEHADDSLPEPVRQQLLDLAAGAERLFASPQDIEWACRDRKVWLLQARPIATRRPPPEADIVVWSNFNVVENLPNVATPLTWSLLDYAIQRFFVPVFKAAGVDSSKERWLGLVAGRVYMNVGVVLKTIHCLPGFRQVRLAWLFGGHQDALMDTLERQSGKVNPSLREKIVTLARVARLAVDFFRVGRWWSGHKCQVHYAAFIDRLDRLDLRQLSSEDLFARLNSLEHDVLTQLRLPILLGTGMVFHGLFRRACRKWLDDKHGSLANRLISRAGGMASAEPAVALWRMAAFASEHASLRTAIQTARNFTGLSASLAVTAEGIEFLEQWAAFMRRHGHHTAGELDIATPRWSERSDEVLRMVRGCLEEAERCNPSRTLEERVNERERLLTECRVRLRNPLKRWGLKFLLRQTQEWVVFRENAKSEFVRGLAVLRRIYLELDERMVRQGMLERRGDIFFLNVMEVEPVYRGVAAFDARAAVRARREEFARHRAVTPPPVVVGRYDPARHTPPSIDGAARELKGLPVSAGIATGTVRVMLGADTGARVLPGEILVAPFTDPGWTPHFLTAAGLITETGGQLSHGSVVAREYGLPAVVNVLFVTRILQTGDLVRVDGDTGTVTVLNRRAEDYASTRSLDTPEKEKAIRLTPDAT